MANILPPGMTVTMVQNKVYAMPARRTLLFASAAIEASFLEGSAFAALTNANVAPGIETALPFVRSTTVGTLVTVKTY